MVDVPPQPRGRPAAIFDLDNTLLPGPSAERLFIRYLVVRRHFSLRAAVQTLALVARSARQRPLHVLRRRRPYLRGWEVARLEALGEEVVAEVIAPRLAPEGIACLRAHREAGRLTVLLSGSLPFLLAPIARRLGVEQVLGTQLEVAAGAYTGEMTAEHPYGEEKAALARRFAREHGVDLSRSYGYADHHSDAPFLRLFGYPVCVNPTPRLRALAAAAGWPVEEWRAGPSRQASGVRRQ